CMFILINFCICFILFFFIFFFQAEDGIRDLTVTGVQTCALPISDRPIVWRFSMYHATIADPTLSKDELYREVRLQLRGLLEGEQIGRASCRERVEVSVGAGRVKKRKRGVK